MKYTSQESEYHHSCD